MTRLDVKHKAGILDSEISIRATCGECFFYSEDKKKCFHCFPNIRLEKSQRACMYFRRKKVNRKYILNV